MRMNGGPKRKRLDSDAKAAYWLILPFFLFFTLFVLYPLLQNFLHSFTNYNLATRDFIGLSNYTRLLRDKSFLHAVANTFTYTLFSIVPLMALGFVAALCVNRQTGGMYAARTVLIYPYVASTVTASMIWLFMYNPDAGLFNKLLEAVGLPRSDWLFDEKLALPCLIAMGIWKNIGYVMLIFLAALQSVPPSLYEAARVDGAGFVSRTVHITIPSIRPVTFFLLATLSIEGFKTFDQVRIMTNGGPVDATTTITHQIYMRAFSEFKMGYASAMSVVLFLLVLGITLLNLKFGGQLDSADREGD